MNRKILKSVLLGLIGGLLIVAAPSAQQPQPTRSIVKIAGELYRAQNDNHYNVFLVTPDGIIMTDPINRDFSRWLKAEFVKRFNVLNGAEYERGPLGDVYPPTTTFADRHTVTLGGKRAIMVYMGIAHAPDSTAIYFPDERTVFGADTLQVRRLPGGLDPSVGAWIDAMRTVLALYFDIAATGHALSGTKKDIAALLQYLEDISAGVAAGIGAGRSLAEIQKTVTLEPYRGWERYDTNRQAHIAQVYATLKGTRVATGTR